MKDTIKKGTMGLGLSSLLFTAQAGAADKTYVLAGSKLPPAGMVTVETSGDEMPETPMDIVANGQKMSGSMQEKSSHIETMTFLGADKFTQEVNKASSERTTTVNGQPHKEDAPAKTLEKTPVTYERKDGKWSVSLADGGKLSDEQLKELGAKAEKPFESDDAMFGATPHKVGDKWNVDVSKLPGFGGVNGATGTMTCELTEIKKVQDLSAGVVKITFDIAGAQGGDEGPKMKMHMKGEGKSVRCTDFSLELETAMDAVMEVEIEPAPGVTIKTSGPYKVRGAVEVKKKP